MGSSPWPHRLLHVATFAIGVNILANSAPVPLAVALPYAITRRLASKPPQSHSRTCRSKTMLAVGVITSVVCGAAWGAVATGFVACLPRMCLWWPRAPPVSVPADSVRASLELVKTKPVTDSPSSAGATKRNGAKDFDYIPATIKAYIQTHTHHWTSLRTIFTQPWVQT